MARRRLCVTVRHVLCSHRWRYRQPADRSPWGAVEDAGSASTAAVNTLVFPANHHAATLPQSGTSSLLCPHGWVGICQAVFSAESQYIKTKIAITNLICMRVMLLAFEFFSCSRWSQGLKHFRTKLCLSKNFDNISKLFTNTYFMFQIQLYFIFFEKVRKGNRVLQFVSLRAKNTVAEWTWMDVSDEHSLHSLSLDPKEQFCWEGVCSFPLPAHLSCTKPF